MGKSPGKWIKSVLFGGRKSSKSNMSKARANIKPANGEETLFSAELPVSNRNAAPPLTSHPLPETYAGNEVDSSSGQVRVVSLSHDGTALPSTKRDGDGTKDINDPESIRLEQAASEVQAAFRGYLARRAFRALKGIIRLQALVRGHLVRRQSAATLCCVLGIVRFQALVRGQKVRRSGIAVELHGKQILGNDQGAKSSKSFEMVKSTQMEKLSKKDFVRKVLALSPSAMPLRLQYGPGEPNSSWDWLERWTKSRIWEPQPVQKKSSESKSQIKHGSSKSMNTEQGRAKRGVQRAPNANAENGSINSTSESEKFKRNVRKVSSHSVESSLEHPPTEIEKVKRSLRKISNPIAEASDRLDADTEKPKRTPRKASSSTAPEVSERGISDSAEKTKKGIAMTESKPLDADGKTQKDMEMTESKDIEAEESPKLPPSAEPVDPPEEHPNTDLQTKVTYGVDEDSPSQVIKGLSSIDDQISDENQKTGRRRASLPAQQDDQENGLHSTTKVPSYMAATESAKAKLRIQASPKFGHDGSEKNGFTRRHSLPSSTNGKLSSLSPRVQKLVQAGSGKGGIRVDRSLSSSRDCNDKVIQPGWRR